MIALVFLTVTGWTTGVWIDDFTDERTPYATAISEDGLSRVTVYAPDPETQQVRVRTAYTLAARIASIDLRVDQGEIITHEVAEQNGNSLLLYFPVDHPIFSRLANGALLRVRVPLLSGRSETLPFTLSGSKSALSALPEPPPK